MRVIFAMLGILAISSSPLYSEWVGLPISTNKSWWYVQDTYGVVSQVWYSAVERAYVCGGENDEGDSYSFSVNAFDGLTNGIYSTTNLTRLVSIAPNIAESSYIGAFTNVVNGTNFYAYPIIRGEFLSSIMLQIQNGENIDDGGDSWGCIYNYAVASTNYNTWFSTANGSGAYPDGFPMVSVQYVFLTNNIGYITNTVYDSWGHVWIGTAVANGEDDLTNAHVETFIGTDVLLSQHAYLGSWTQTLAHPLMGSAEQFTYKTDSYPVARFYPSGATNSITVTLYGKELAPNDYNITPVSVSESVSFSSSDVEVPLTNWWFSVTNMTVSGTARAGDVVSVSYTNDLTMYVPYVNFANGWGRMPLEEKLNTIYYTTSEMTHFAGHNSTSNGVTGAWRDTTRVIWSYSSLVSWSDATNNCASATPTTSTISRAAAHYTDGSYDGTRWVATRTKIDSKPIAVDGQSSGLYARNAQWYMKCLPYTAGGESGANAVVDNFDTTINETYFQLYDSGGPSVNSITGSVVSSSTYTWCAEPFVGTPTSRGFVAESRVVQDYSITNGFVFK